MDSRRPLLSWRVALLPFLEEGPLYKKFKLDEPWDGPNNKALLPHMPRLFDMTVPDGDPEETFYQVFVGPGAVFERDPMRPYDGPSTPGVDCSTLSGKVLCGYQGWFTTPGDGSDRGWRHYSTNGPFKPGSCGIDLWPDVSELDDDEKYATAFHNSDGGVAQVFSSHNRKSVLRHFRWMREYGIDGVFVQRFGVETSHPKDLRHCNTVLSHCREAANRQGRCYAVMYDLSGLPADGTRQVIEDWKLLVDRMHIGRDPKDAAYLRHDGKPVVAVWGIGFNAMPATPIRAPPARSPRASIQPPGAAALHV